MMVKKEGEGRVRSGVDLSQLTLHDSNLTIGDWPHKECEVWEWKTYGTIARQDSN